MRNCRPGLTVSPRWNKSALRENKSSRRAQCVAGKIFVKFCRKVLQKGNLSGKLSAGNTGTTSGDRKALARNAALCRSVAPLNTADENPRRRAYYTLFPFSYNRGRGCYRLLRRTPFEFFRGGVELCAQRRPCVSDSGCPGGRATVPHRTPCQDRNAEKERRRYQTKIDLLEYGF